MDDTLLELREADAESLGRYDTLETLRRKRRNVIQGLLDHIPSVDGQRLPHDERRGIGAEPDHRFGHLLRSAQPSNGMARHNGVLALGVLAEEAFEHRAVDERGAH